MIISGLTSDGDFTFGQGLADYLTDNAAIGLNIRTRILSWLNDCFFDQDAGIDWINRIGSLGQQQLLEADLKRIILQSYGVKGIITFNTHLIDRAFTLSCSVDTIFSQAYLISINQEL